ncbi:uncharacterized protein LOC129584764 isoform X2 [Paramacrobiotus metropolitanus]|uniref:uncharacterized protein LOC129584764 isoform X2 n=1 Tax=Paramacrobiotus metropolitanus TaxID=2943436 RepID=UPI0024456E4F|nr:uncharacterized protein LOC129584764 isoform X2 [Paramacrobiotus metropolitanus]
MPAVGRKPLEDYQTTYMDTDQSSSSPRTRSAAQRTPNTTRRSESPNKNSPSKMYPDLSQLRNEEGVPAEEHVYEEIREDENGASARWVYESTMGGPAPEDEFVQESLKPQPPPRVRKAVATRNVADGEVERKTLPEGPLWLIIVAVAFGVLAFFARHQVASYWNWYWTPTDSQHALDRFHENFKNFTADFKNDIHPDSLNVLRHALEHHVEIAENSKQQYPTCILLAGDRAGSKSLNCLAGRIAEMIPFPASKNPPKRPIYTVDLKDDSHLHNKDPDHEDLRSRVHSGINEGINNGAKIVVFRNLEALIPKDIPLLQLFYSYCDGENPTFPKTLWILTVGTENVTYADEREIEIKTDTHDTHRSLGRKVEEFLERILEGNPDDAEAAERVRKRTSGNPILTRIANYIIPVLKAPQTTGKC